jgi:hypothetical protein
MVKAGPILKIMFLPEIWSGLFRAFKKILIQWATYLLLFECN